MGTPRRLDNGLHVPPSGRGAAGRTAPGLRLLVLGAVAALGLAACGSRMPMAMPSGHEAPAGAASASAGAVEVGIATFAFAPAAVTVRVGSTVDWTNRDGVPHTVSFAGSGPASAVLRRGDRFSRTFTAPGTYAYVCSIHPFMHGTVAVVP
jgi:amicyanin